MKKKQFKELLKVEQEDQLAQALENNDLDFIKKNLKVNEGFLYKTIYKGNLEIFEYVFLHCPKEIQDKSVLRILSSGHIDLFDFALKHVDFDPTDSRAYEMACRSGNLDLVKKIEKMGAEKTSLSFYYALDSGNVDLVEYLYEGEDFCKYFHPQSHVLSLPIVKFIMSKAPLSKEHQRKILLGAAGAGLIDVIDYLLAQPDPPDNSDLLFETVYMGNQLPTMKYLLTKAPILSKVEEEDYAAFIWAYEKGYEEFVDYLINEHGVGPQSSPEVLRIMLADGLAIYEKYHKIDL